MRTFLFLGTGILFVLLQTTIMPLFLEPDWRPNLILILVLYLGVSSDLLRAVVGGILLGAIQDSFCGSVLGLYVVVYLVVILVAQLLSGQLNAESPPLLLLLVAGGTLLQNLLVGFLLMLFADTAPVLYTLLPALPQQVLVNVLSGLFLLLLSLRFQRVFGFRSSLARLLSKRKTHGS